MNWVTLNIPKLLHLNYLCLEVLRSTKIACVSTAYLLMFIAQFLMKCLPKFGHIILIPLHSGIFLRGSQHNGNETGFPQKQTEATKH